MGMKLDFKAFQAGYLAACERYQDEGWFEESPIKGVTMPDFHNDCQLEYNYRNCAVIIADSAGTVIERWDHCTQEHISAVKDLMERLSDEE